MYIAVSTLFHKFLCYKTLIAKLIIKDLFEIKHDLKKTHHGKTNVKIINTTTNAQTNRMSMFMMKIHVIRSC